MKKILLIAIIGIGISGYSKEIKKSNKKAITTEIDCWLVYSAAKKAAKDEGFSDTKAMEIGMAAYYGCRNTKTVTIE